ncbi:1-phosphatidylinositol 4,5-bisphosphate phosphodiesterase classes I and II [Eumeta japonica]|uniref:1-phosphatidylinositol 4,5-bisphosphate phosphodiesterase classes I and II n=1 Tax=Eumeta variegata TaxID=151549 RepID=A0A4C1S877_EUMVA|nr:1-phosphatidylinositol 4,5-bisphosphate phosphodiesterase classes I and II [Eumeta japonica]
MEYQTGCQRVDDRRFEGTSEIRRRRHGAGWAAEMYRAETKKKRMFILIYSAAVCTTVHATVPLPRQGSKESSESSDSDSLSGEEEAGAGEAAEDGRETHAGAEISALVNYVQPVHFSSFENAESEFYASICVDVPLSTNHTVPQSQSDLQNRSGFIFNRSRVLDTFEYVLRHKQRKASPVLASC